MPGDLAPGVAGCGQRFVHAAFFNRLNSDATPGAMIGQREDVDWFTPITSSNTPSMINARVSCGSPALLAARKNSVDGWSAVSEDAESDPADAPPEPDMEEERPHRQPSMRRPKSRPPRRPTKGGCYPLQAGAPGILGSVNRLSFDQSLRGAKSTQLIRRPIQSALSRGPG